MQVETTIKIEFEDVLGDSGLDEDLTKEQIDDYVERHLQDYCEERKIDRSDVEIINKEIIK